jgi:type IV secretory pathway VirB4 component
MRTSTKAGDGWPAPAPSTGVAGLLRRWLQMRAAAVPLPDHAATSGNLAAIYPWVGGSTLGPEGIPIGEEVWGGGAVCWDPFRLYRRGVISSPGSIVIGQVGSGKSSLVKTIMLRGSAFGYRSVVIDPKGEYGPLAEAMGCKVIRLEPGGEERLNPLELAGDDAGARGLQSKLLLRVLEAKMRTPIPSQDETMLVDVLEVATRRAQGMPTMSDVVDVAGDPPQEIADATGIAVDELRKRLWPYRQSLRGLTQAGAELGGMFDGQTTVQPDWDAPLVVIDLSALLDSPGLHLTLICVLSWLTSVLRREGSGRRFLVVDEAWKVIQDPAVALWLLDASKLARQWGLALMLVMHHLGDLETASKEVLAAAQSLLTQMETRVVMRQKPERVKGVQAAFELSDAEASQITTLRDGEAMWTINDEVIQCQHRLTAWERGLIDTDAELVGGLR